jgi:hypothetical protein
MFQTLLILHLLGFAAGVGTSIFMAWLGGHGRDMPEAERAALMGQAGPIASRLGAIGYVLLVVTGLAMLWQDDWAWVEAGGHWFWLKMTLVIVLGALIGAMHALYAKMRRGADPALVAAKLERLGKIVLVASIALVLSAVLAFR